MRVMDYDDYADDGYAGSYDEFEDNAVFADLAAEREDREDEDESETECPECGFPYDFCACGEAEDYIDEFSDADPGL
jgi:hypothetical protein